MLDLLESSDWQLAEAMVEACDLSASRASLLHFSIGSRTLYDELIYSSEDIAHAAWKWRMWIVNFASWFLVPFTLTLMVRGSVPAFAGSLVSPSGFIFSYRTPNWCCARRMPERHKNGFHGDFQLHSVSVCSLCQHQSNLTMTWLQCWRKKWNTENCHTNQTQTQCSHQKRHHRPREIDAWVCRCRRYFGSTLTLELIHVEYFLLSSMLISHKPHTERFFSLSWCKRNLQRVQDEAFFSLVSRNVLHQEDKNALRSTSVLKWGWKSTSSILLVFTAVIKCLPSHMLGQTICQTLLSCNVSKIIDTSWTGFRNMEIMWFVSFCSSKWIVLAVITPGSSRQSSCEYLQLHLTSPSKIHGEIGMNQNISWMSTAHRCKEHNLFDLLTFVVNKTSMRHSILRRMLSLFC